MRRRPPRGAREQPDPEVLLQPGHPLGHGLLGDGQAGRGLGELAGVRHRDERAHGFQVHAA